MGIPCKTAAGHAELAVRQRGLSQRHRTLLFIVDGKRSLEDVIELGTQAGVPKAYIDELMALGLVAMAAPAAAPAGTAISQPGELIGSYADQATEPQPLSRSQYASPGGGLAAWRRAAQHPVDAGDTVAFEDAVSNTEMAAADAGDLAVAQARSLLLQALRSHAPVVGAVTMLRVRRVRQRTALIGLLDEVHTRLERNHERAELQQLMERVVRLLAS